MEHNPFPDPAWAQLIPWVLNLGLLAALGGFGYLFYRFVRAHERQRTGRK